MTFSSDALVQSITFKAQDDASPVFKRLGEAAESLTAKFENATGADSRLTP
jgi:hypothetical protein